MVTKQQGQCRKYVSLNVLKFRYRELWLKKTVLSTLGHNVGLQFLGI